MTKQSRRKFSAGFMAKVALEAINNEKTLAELSQQFEVYAVTIFKWKTEFLENMAIVFEYGRKKKSDQRTPELDDLHAQIGQLKVENDFFKKKCQETWDIGQRLEMIKPQHKELSIRKQCEILMVPRNSLSYPRQT